MSASTASFVSSGFNALDATSVVSATGLIGIFLVLVVETGFWLGSQITGIDKYLLPTIAVVVVLSLLPIAIELLKIHRRKSTTPGRGRSGAGTRTPDVQGPAR